MLTGDKLETAICIAKSSKLVSRTHDVHVLSRVTDRAQAHLELNSLRRKNEAALVISGDSLQVRVREVQLSLCKFVLERSLSAAATTTNGGRKEGGGGETWRPVQGSNRSCQPEKVPEFEMNNSTLQIQGLERYWNSSVWIRLWKGPWF